MTDQCPSFTANIAKTLIEHLQNDLRLLTTEAKRNASIKEASEAAIMKLRGANNAISTNSRANLEAFRLILRDVIRPFSIANKTKQPRVVQMSLTALQRLVAHNVVYDSETAVAIVDDLWVLMEAEIEELRLLQTIALLGNSAKAVQGSVLAKALVLCFRLNFAKDPFVINTASATVRQLVAQVFERLQEQKENESIKTDKDNKDRKLLGKSAPKSLPPTAADAFMLFQDLCRLVNAEPPYWLMGITEMTRTLGLDLLEMVLVQNVKLFSNKFEFVVLLKELVCPLVIKLFSPNLKYYQNQQRNQIGGGSGSVSPSDSPTSDKPYFPIVMRLTRLVYTLISRYHEILSTECEIFLSLLLKLLDCDKLDWQRALAIESIYRIVTQKKLLRYFCENYDIKPHSTRILRELISSIYSFLHTSFVIFAEKTISANPENETNDIPMNQPCFVFANVFVPYINNATMGSPFKSLYFDMLEKIDPPLPFDGYLISLAYVCVTEFVQSVERLINEDMCQTDSEKKNLPEQLLSSTHNSLLSCLSLLLESSLDENLIDSILKSFTVILQLICKFPSLSSIRDAYLSTLCSAALPVNYFSSIIPGGRNVGLKSMDTEDVRRNVISNVVAMSSPCPVLGMQPNLFNTTVMLTTKNLQVVRCLLNASLQNAQSFQQSWHLVLVTLQHLTWLLNLKPTVTGALKPVQAAELGASSSSLVQASSFLSPLLTTAAMSDVTVIAETISHLFEKTSTLDVVALHHVINALCALSSESVQISSEGREPSFFAVCKLLELSSYNLFRAEQFFKPVSSHLIDLCSQPYPKLREWGTIALITIIRSAFVADKDYDFQIVSLLINGLSSLNDNPYEDVVLQEIECVLQILRTKGQNLYTTLWPRLIESIGSVPKNSASEALIRQAFQAVQLISADMLPSLSAVSMFSLLDVVTRFAAQTKDLNISLSAVGVLWNISDYLYRSGLKTVDNVAVDELWLALYANLARMCVDGRPAVRKSACQTLFGTLSSHGANLQPTSWCSVLWKVLFPLLTDVKTNSFEASNEKVEDSFNVGGGAILIHHSRDTESKQWAETAALTLSGVARVFSSKRSLLSNFGDYSRAWSMLLQFVQDFACHSHSEVSSGALRSFYELLSNKNLDASASSTSPHTGSNSTSYGSGGNVVIINQPGRRTSRSDSTRSSDFDSTKMDVTMWLTAWKVWLHISTIATDINRIKSEKLAASSTATITKPSQCVAILPNSTYLCLLLRLFIVLFSNVKNVVDSKDLLQCFQVLKNIVLVPLYYDNDAAITLPANLLSSTANNVEMLPSQELILNCLNMLYREFSGSNSRLRFLLPDFFQLCFSFVTLCCELPPKISTEKFSTTAHHNYANNEETVKSASKNDTANFINQTYVCFAEQVLKLVTDFYANSSHFAEVIEAGVVTQFVRTISLPLSLKYRCPSESSWKLALQSLMTIIRLSVTFAKDVNKTNFENFWPELANCMELYLFHKNPPKRPLNFEEQKRDEYLDCQLVEIIRSDILPQAKLLPVSFVNKTMDLLRRGSIHDYDPKDLLGCDSNRKLRTELSRICFDALLDVSRGEPDLVQCSVPPHGGNSAGPAALDALLDRCHQVIAAFGADDRESAGTPLPRHRIAEMTHVLTAVGTLVDSLSLHNAPGAATSADSSATTNAIGPKQVRPRPRMVWDKLFALYPLLVNTIPCREPDIQRTLIQTLKQFGTFLSPPKLL